jgi:SPP1 gp7 family putative phage head morphogenesis protein
MKLLPPQRMTKAYYADIEEGINGAAVSFLFAPLVGIIRRNNPQKKTLAIVNAIPSDALVAAILSGKIQYRNGIFSGEFNAAITRALVAIGARYNERRKFFFLEPARVPPHIAMQSAVYESTAQQTYRELARLLDEKLLTLTEGIPSIFHVPADGVVGKIEKGFKESAAQLAFVPVLEENSKKNLARDYSENLALSIQDFNKDMILSLRADVEESARAGYRFDILAGKIAHKFNVSRRKSEFLAKTETSIFMSEFRKNEFAEVGIVEYFWRTSGDSRVRQDHRLLNGKRFSYDRPPVADRATGTTANPGGIWGCRCLDYPILPGE